MKKRLTNKKSGRASHGITSLNSTLIAAFHLRLKQPRAHRRCLKTPDELRYQEGRFYFVNASGACQITMGAAVEKFLRFYTSEYFEGSTERADLLLNDTTDKLTARRVNGEIERLSKQWSTGKRLRMASVFTSWAKYLGGVR